MVISEKEINPLLAGVKGECDDRMDTTQDKKFPEKT